MTSAAIYARSYARALFGAASATASVDAIRADLSNVLGVILASPEIRRWIVRRAPGSPPRRIADVRRFFSGAAGGATMRLLEQMAAWNHLHLIPDVARRFEAAARKSEGRITAHVVCADPPDAAATTAIQNRIATINKTFEVELRSDPRLLAGLTVRVGDRLIDASLAGRLARIRRLLTNPSFTPSPASAS
jgi:F-type H+-transporting ATPase subunit delta